ncbi:MAG: hypothetical protein Q9214_002977 [Letrouitia sp. 1 TL-2023]
MDVAHPVTLYGCDIALIYVDQGSSEATFQHKLQDSPVEAMANGSVTRSRPQLEDEEKHDKVLRTFRCLVADLCQQFNGGHAGGAMSMAAIGIALYRYIMKYSPLNPVFFNRDRLVLSNGHTCLWQYIFMHWTSFRAMTFEQLKSYHSPRQDSLCPSHPQIQHDGIDVTTGPLGQGVANAVGLAVATKHLNATYSRPGLELLNNMTWCIIGDADLQEGVALEAIQLAGHWRLDNLVIVYDNNQVTYECSVDVTCSEDINAKMTACGWNVIDVFDGVSNVTAIVHALEDAQANQEQPTFVNVRTIIGFGSAKEGDSSAHGGSLGEEGVRIVKQRFGMNPEEHFRIDPDIYEFFQKATARGTRLEAQFEQKLRAYGQAYPELAHEFRHRMEGNMVDDWRKYIPNKENLRKDKLQSRESAALIFAALAKRLNTFMVGTADVRPPVNMSWEGHVAFQHPNIKTECGMSGDYTGRYLHCGIREHAMVSIANGLAAFNPGTILPVTSGFFMFYIYSAAGVRMGAMQGLQAIHLATHDSIAIGHDGPTHQPVELPALFRAMPNLLYVRPCDSEETCGAFTVALESKTTPTIISLSRHALTQFPQHSSRGGVKNGAYVFIEQEKSDLTLIGVGSEMAFTVDVRNKLMEEGIKTRIVSFPCQRLFEIQTQEYKEAVMQYRKRKPVVVIEAYVVNGWERYADAGYSMSSFGKSLPTNTETYKFFKFSGELIAAKVKAFVDEVRAVGVEALRGDFRDLNGGVMGYGWNPL